MGERGRGQKVRRSRPRTRGAKHEATAQPGFGIARSREAHALLVLASVKRQRAFDVLQSLAQAGHVAMTKNPEASPAQPRLLAVDLDKLSVQITHDRLGRGQRDCFRHVRVLPTRALAIWR